MFRPSIAYEWRELTDDGRLVTPVCSYISSSSESEAEAYVRVQDALAQGLISEYNTVKLVLVKTMQPRPRREEY